MVERFFAEITRKRIRRGVFKSVDELKQAIMDYLDNQPSMTGMRRDGFAGPRASRPASMRPARTTRAGILIGAPLGDNPIRRSTGLMPATGPNS
jgi:hypothetical protein